MIGSFIILGPALGQKSFGVSASVLSGFRPQEVYILEEPISFGMAVGVETAVSRAFYLKQSPIQIQFGLGGKYFYSTGETGGDLPFSTEVFRLNGFVGARYAWKQGWRAGVQFAIENNRDFQETTYIKADLWRYYVRLDGAFQWHPHWEVFGQYAVSLAKNQDVYLMYLPSHQLGFGVRYFFHEM